MDPIVQRRAKNVLDHLSPRSVEVLTDDDKKIVCIAANFDKPNWEKSLGRALVGRRGCFTRFLVRHYGRFFTGEGDLDAIAMRVGFVPLQFLKSSMLEKSPRELLIEDLGA